MQEMTVNAKGGQGRCAIAQIVGALALVSCLIDPSCTRAQGSPSPSAGHGRMWYEKYCTPCHGIGGAPGSAEFATTKQPIDLRTYVQRRGGKFPVGDWLMVVFGEPPQNPHTDIFERMRHDESGSTNSEVVARGKVRSIADYVVSIQEK